METVKVLSLKQPWASMVVRGIKGWETRDWQTKYRGVLYIHASSKFLDEDKALSLRTPFANYIDNYDLLPLGQIIGKVELVDIITTAQWLAKYGKSATDIRELKMGNYGPNRHAWQLENAVMFATPTRAKGALSVWDFDKSNLLEI